VENLLTRRRLALWFNATARDKQKSRDDYNLSSLVFMLLVIIGRSTSPAMRVPEDDSKLSLEADEDNQWAP
jgi:hypothetical protein